MEIFIRQAPTAHRMPSRKGVWQRKQSVKYFLKFKEHDEVIIQKVCKQFFWKTFEVSNGHLQRLLEKKVQGIEPESDKRGLHTPANKTREDAVNLYVTISQIFQVYNLITHANTTPIENTFHQN